MAFTIGQRVSTHAICDAFELIRLLLESDCSEALEANTKTMLEYGLLTGIGGTLGSALVGAFEVMIRFGNDLMEVVFDYPAVSLGLFLALLVWGLVRMRR